MTSFVTHLEGAIDGAKLDPSQPHQMHAGRPILVRYDLARVRNAVKPGDLLSREKSLWRYRELLPVADPSHIVTLGEGSSPLLRADRLGNLIGLKKFLVKDESQLPTGSFKSRGQTTAMSMCKRFGIQRVALPTAGNAGGAAAAYAARAGIECFVFMPSDTPIINQVEAAAAGAHVFLVDGLINDCGKIVGAGMQPMGWFDLSTLKEPYRVEGKKTMGIELAEQVSWTLPDVILYPTGGGTGLIGMWKAFAELRELGWLKSKKLPRMVSVQPEGCCPIVRAFRTGSRFAEPFANAHTVASGLRVPVAVGDFLMLDAIRESHGTAVAVSDDAILDWMHRGIAAEGISFCPESAACIAAAHQLSASGWIEPNENVVLFNCGAFQKYPHLMTPKLPKISSPASIDWDWITTVASAAKPA